MKRALLLWLHNELHLVQQEKIYESEMVLYFISVSIINRTLHDHLEIQNFSSCVKKIFYSFAPVTREIVFNTRREILYLHAAM